MSTGIRALVLPEQQRRTLRELSADLDLREGDARSKQTAFWTMLVLSAVIASAGILTDSTATVIGAMIIAPLSTPIMGIALGIAERSGNRSLLFVATGAATVVAIGAAFSLVVPSTYDLLSNSQISGRTSPGLLDMIAAIATGLAGAVALARRDVAAVLPGVAIAISLVPPLAVVGVCLGQGAYVLAAGAAVLFLSTLVAMVLAGTLVFTFLGYAEDAAVVEGRSPRRAYTVLVLSLVAVLVPLAIVSVTSLLVYRYSRTVQLAAQSWVQSVPGAVVTGVTADGRTLTVDVQTPDQLPEPALLVQQLQGQLSDLVTVVVRANNGTQVDVWPAASPA